MKSPSDIRITHGSLFSGIGGWSVASDQMGWQTAFMCEWDEDKQYVLKHHWPKAKIYGNIIGTDFIIWRGRIDILTASTPCQPFSLAGKRQGANDVRHLWPETLRTIREIQPPFFVLENVPGLVNWSKGMVFQQIITDLENEGYEVLPFLLPACGVNAPHKRERLWVVAYSGLFRSQIGQLRTMGVNELCEERDASDSTNSGLEGLQQRENRVYECGIASDSSEQRQQIRQSDNGRTYSEENRAGMDNRPERSGSIGNASDTYQKRCERCELNGTSYPGGTESGRQSKGQPYKPASKLHKTTNWSDFPTVSPLRPGDDGFSRDALRLFINENSGGLLTEKEVNQIIQKSLNKWNNRTIAAGGDAIVPDVALQIFKAIDQMIKQQWGDYLIKKL